MGSNYFDKAMLTFRSEGIFPLLSKGVLKIASVFFKMHTSLWLVKDLKQEAQAIENPSDYSVELEDFDAIVEWMKRKNREYPWMYCEKEIAVARENQHVIPFLKIDNAIVGYTKVAFNKVYIRDYEAIFRLAPNKAMFYDTTLLNEFRGKKLPQYLKKEIFRFLKKRNIEYVYAHIEPWNIASIKSNRGLGFREVCLNRFIKILNVKFHSNSPARLLSENR